MTRTRFDNMSTSAARRAFTLVEMVVVVGIIVLLLALTVGVTVALSAKSEERQVQSVLTLLDQAMHEWETISERSITFGTPDQPAAGAVYEIDETQFPIADEAKQAEMISRVLAIIGRNQQTQDVLKQISADFYNAEPIPGSNPPATRNRIHDPWDNNIRVVFPGRKWVTGDPNDRKDKDGTFRTDAELRYGVCASSKIAFLSMGGDSFAGDLHLDKDEASLTAQDLADIQKAADNLYSYDLLRERP